MRFFKTKTSSPVKTQMDKAKELITQATALEEQGAFLNAAVALTGAYNITSIAGHEVEARVINTEIDRLIPKAKAEVQKELGLGNTSTEDTQGTSAIRPGTNDNFTQQWVSWIEAGKKAERDGDVISAVKHYRSAINNTQCFPIPVEAMVLGERIDSLKPQAHAAARSRLGLE